MKKTIVVSPSDLRNTNFRKMVIDIRLSDDCKNGYSDFAITGMGWHKNSKRSSCDCCGCMHDDILLVRPDLKPIVDFHLRREDGSPMYVVENGFYYYQITQGVAKYHIMREGDEIKYFNYLKAHLLATDEEMNYLYKELAARDNKVECFTLFANSLRPRWKEEADKVKALIESL